MFDRIASRYDQLNRVMTLGLDISWRKKLNALLPSDLNHWVDIATGTGDQIVFFLNQNLKATQITGIDLSENMLSIAKDKLSSFPHVSLQKASMTNLPFETSSICALTCSFGIRNVESFEDALKEFNRVLKPGGVILILESSRPQNKLLQVFHASYMRFVLPVLAKALKTDPDAYSYLAQTTSQFPCGQNFCNHLMDSGFNHVMHKPMALGSVTVYYGKKHESAT